MERSSTSASHAVGLEPRYSFSIPSQPLCSSIAVGTVLKPQLTSTAAVANQTETRRTNLCQRPSLRLAQQFSSVGSVFECLSVRMPHSPANCSVTSLQNGSEKTQSSHSDCRDLSRASRRYLGMNRNGGAEQTPTGNEERRKG